MKSINKKSFTPQMIEKLNPLPEGRLEIGDNLCPGLLLRITDRGVKSFSVIYRVMGEGGLSPAGRLLAGRQHRITLGRWPTIDLTEARKKAREILIAASQGNDPRIERTTALALKFENSVEKVIERYIERQAKVSVKDWKVIQSALNRIVIPEWGNRVMSDITRKDAHALLDKIAEQRGPRMASEMKRMIGRVFSWSLDRDIIIANPFTRMDRPEDEKYTPRDRFLSDNELRLVWQASNKLGYPVGPAIKLIILTGLRRSNVDLAQWGWIDPIDKLLTVPKDHFKSKRIHQVPLSSLACEIVEKLPRYNHCDWLFKAKRGDGAIDCWSLSKKRLDNIITQLNDGQPLPNWTIHDIRHTVKTGLSRLRVSSEVKDRILGHNKKGMDAVYDHHHYQDEKREALELWAQHIQNILR